MGGIACYFQFDSSQNKDVLDDGNLMKSLEYINHRGPDFRGAYFSDCGRTGLGYVQLSVVGMDNSQQTLYDQENDIHIVLDGGLYDLERIKRELQAKGYQLRTESVSEIALCLYQEYGLSFLDHLSGEFSVCIWDAKKSRFILARDRFGTKPLYYTIVKGALLVASEIKAFLPLGWHPEWDVDSLLNNGVMFDCRTAFKGVNKLPPAHYMAASSGGSIQIRPFWCQKYANKRVKNICTVESMVQGVRDRLVDAVKQRLGADVALGIYLDESVNTSCIAGIASQIRKEANSKEKIKTFSLTIVDDDELSENMVVKRIAEFCNADLEVLQVSEEDLLNNFEESLWHVEQPHLDLHSVGRFMLSKLVRDQGYNVVLTGEGAEEHFAGHPHFIKDYLREADNSVPDGFGTLLDEKRAEMLQKMDTEMDNVGSKNAVDNMLNDSTAPAFLERSFTLTRSFHSEAAIKKYRHRNPTVTVAEALNGISRNNANSKWHPLHTAMSVQCTTLLPNHVLSSFSDRPTMAHSVEARLPFLDHQLCDYVNSLPPSVKIKADDDGRLIDKWILREAAKPYVTAEVYQSSNPQSYYASSSDTAFIKLSEKHLTKEKIGRLGWISYNTVKAAKESYRITKSHKTHQDLLIIMSYVVLSEQFNVATARFEEVTFCKTKQVNSVKKQLSEQNHKTAISAILQKVVMTAVVVTPMVYAYYFQ
ncbi:asparagine synthase [Mucor ambiguus]|uniref:Asparagine synthase n=1 Tax=Mucor ambiguus TaxID=91626 RepID=A0A0C9M9C3_9FUNG|nr:asparagine synthase [Mucor ambiguus]